VYADQHTLPNGEVTTQKHSQWQHTNISITHLTVAVRKAQLTRTSIFCLSPLSSINMLLLSSELNVYATFKSFILP
jgi:hypothetical protein